MKEHDKPYIEVFDQLDLNGDKAIDDKEMQEMIDMMDKLEEAQETYREHNGEVGKVVLGELGAIGLGTTAGAVLLGNLFAPVLGGAIGYIATVIPTLIAGHFISKNDVEAANAAKENFLKDVDYHPYAEQRMDQFFGMFDVQ